MYTKHISIILKYCWAQLEVILRTKKNPNLLEIYPARLGKTGGV